MKIGIMGTGIIATTVSMTLEYSAHMMGVMDEVRKSRVI